MSGIFFVIVKETLNTVTYQLETHITTIISSSNIQ